MLLPAAPANTDTPANTDGAESSTSQDRALAGASGEWRVRKRVVEFMARVGEEGIFERD